MLPELFRVLRPDRDDIVLAGDGQLETLLELNTRPLSPPLEAFEFCWFQVYRFALQVPSQNTLGLEALVLGPSTQLREIRPKSIVCGQYCPGAKRFVVGSFGPPWFRV